MSASTRQSAAAALVLIALTVAAYWPIHRNDFVNFDDETYIYRNSVVRQGLTAQGLVLAFTKSYVANWHPLTWISHMIDIELFGLDPRGHHFVGVTIHLAAALALLLTLRAMTGTVAAPLAVATLFAVHPLHVESVAWAAERKDVLSALFWMLTMAAHVRYARRPGAGRLLPVVLLYTLGLMSKPMLVTLPIVLLLLDYWPLGRFRAPGTPGTADAPAPLPRLLLEKAPLFLLAVLSALITVRAQRVGGAMAPFDTLPMAARVANAALSPWLYLRGTIWPVDLAFFYPFTKTPVAPTHVAAAAALVAVTAGAWLLRRRHPWLLGGWLWYLVTLLPVLGIIQVGEQARADRYTYLPLLGIFIALSWAVAAAPRPRAAVVAALSGCAVVALSALVVLTRRQVAVWHDETTLVRHAIQVTGENWKATYLLGAALHAAGDQKGAMRLYRDSIRMKPDFSRARYGLARLLDDQGRAEEAIAELQAAVDALTTDPVVRMELALMLSREGRDDAAIVHLRELIAIRPQIAEGYNNLAVLLARRGETKEAADLLRRALEIDPSYPDARVNLEALTGERPPEPAGRGAPPGVPTTHRGLFGQDP